MDAYLEMIRKESVVESEDKEDAESEVSGFSFTEAVEDFSTHIKETRHSIWDGFYEKYENVQDDGLSLFSLEVSEDENKSNKLSSSLDEKTEKSIHEVHGSYEKPIRGKSRSNLIGSSLTKRSASDGSSSKSLNSRPKKKTKINISGDDKISDLVNTGQFQSLLQHSVRTELQKQTRKLQRTRKISSRRIESSRNSGYKYFKPHRSMWSNNFQKWSLRKSNILDESEIYSPATSPIQLKSELDETKLQINSDETNQLKDSHLYDVTNILKDVNKADKEVSRNNEVGINDDQENQRPDTEKSALNTVGFVEEPQLGYSTDNSKVTKSVAKVDDLPKKRSRYNTRSSVLSSSLYNTSIINKSLEQKTPLKEKISESQSGNKSIDLKSKKSQNVSLELKSNKSQNESLELISKKLQNDSLELTSTKSQNESLELKSEKSQNESLELKSKKSLNELKSIKKEHKEQTPKSIRMPYCTRSATKRNKENANSNISEINDVIPQTAVSTNIPPSTNTPSSTNLTKKLLHVSLTNSLASVKKNVPNVLSNDRNSTNKQENIQSSQGTAKFSQSELMFIFHKNVREELVTADMHYMKVEVKRHKSTGKFIAIMTRDSKKYLNKGNSADDINQSVQFAFKTPP